MDRVILREEELILCKTDKGDQAWSLAEVYKIYPDEIEVIYYTTPRKQLDDYETATHDQRLLILLLKRRTPVQTITKCGTRETYETQGREDRMLIGIQCYAPIKITGKKSIILS